MSNEKVPIFKPDVFARLQVVSVDGGKRIALVDPAEQVDGESIQHFVFDVSHDRSLADFFAIVLGPSLMASGMTLAQFLSRVPESMRPSEATGD